jgi:hypothetical protein
VARGIRAQADLWIAAFIRQKVQTCNLPPRGDGTPTVMEQIKLITIAFRTLSFYESIISTTRFLYSIYFSFFVIKLRLV